jgi:hypothetical protein
MIMIHDVRVLGDVAQAGHHAVAAVFRVGDRHRVDDVDKPGWPSAKAHVAVPGEITGADERHVGAPDEDHHRGVELAQHLRAVKPFGPRVCAQTGLELVFTTHATPHVALMSIAAPTRWRDGCT